MVHMRCDHNLSPAPCLRVWGRGDAGQGSHNANDDDSGPDGKTSKRSDGSAGYCLKSQVHGNPRENAHAYRI